MHDGYNSYKIEPLTFFQFYSIELCLTVVSQECGTKVTNEEVKDPNPQEVEVEPDPSTEVSLVAILLLLLFTSAK